MRPRVLIHVQHLLGAGHLMRAAAIAKATAALDMDVLLVTGGMPHPDVDAGSAKIVQLSPLRTKGTTYATLVDQQDRPIDDAFKAARSSALLDTLHRFGPHMVVTEHFPFGRGKLRFELTPLLDAVRAMRAKPLLFASVRDIIEPPQSQAKSDRFLTTANTHYDALLIHGDPAFASFDLSFPDATRLTPPLHYTGYVGSSRPAPPGARQSRILLSTGTGRTGRPLIEAAVAAHRKDDLGMQWEIRFGVGFSEAWAQEMKAQAKQGLTIVPAKPNFAADLAQCALSVSQAGYNTVVDLVAAATPSVLIPYSGHEECEQILRAQSLGRRGHAIVMEEKSLSPDRLLPAMTEALKRPAGLRPAFATNGAEMAANLIKESLLTSGVAIQQE